MFNWLKGKKFIYKIDKESYEIIDFDEINENFIGYDKKMKREVRVKINEMLIDYRFDLSSLYDKLLNRNYLHFRFISLESPDKWEFTIKRTKTKLTNTLILVNYSIVTNEKIIGSIYSTQLESENKEKFLKWLMKEIDENEVFNTHELYGIFIESSIVSDKETKYIDQLLC